MNNGSTLYGGIAGIVLALGMVLAVLWAMPEINRYIKIRAM